MATNQLSNSTVGRSRRYTSKRPTTLRLLMLSTLLFSLFVAKAYPEEKVTPSIPETQAPIEPSVKILINTEDTSTNEHDDDATLEDDPHQTEDTKTSAIERLVQPFTRWAEDQIHDTALVRPTNKPTQSSSARPKLTLRQAIKIATKTYPGTVLGAEQKLENGETHFDVRIISQHGVVRTIEIQPEQNNPITNTITTEK